jgi:hypothetical protein
MEASVMHGLVSAWSVGGSLCLASVLAFAGVAKMLGPQSLEGLLVRALPPWVWTGSVLTSRRIARLIAVVELTAGATLLAAVGTAGTFASLGAAALFTSFVPVVVWASRRGLGCGCFGKLSQHAARRSDIARSAVLALLAASLFLSRLAVPYRGIVNWPSAVVALLAALAVVTVVPLLISSKLSRTGAGRPGVRIRYEAREPVSERNPLSRRAFFARVGAVTAGSVIGMWFLPKSVQVALADAGWSSVTPDVSSREPGEDHRVWIDYDPGAGDGQWVSVDWDDGTSEGQFASGFEAFFTHSYGWEGDFFPVFTVANASVQGFLHTQWASNMERCWKGLLQCIRCCQNNTPPDYTEPQCAQCCRDCWSDCEGGDGTCPSSGDNCGGCWIAV